MVMLLNVATPAAAVCVSVPPSAPLPGFVEMDRVTLVELLLVTTLLSASSMLTWMLGAMDEFSGAFIGSVVKASCVAVPAPMLKELLAALVSPPPAAVSVYPVPALLMLHPAKEA